MGSFILTDCTVWVDSLAMTTYANELSLSIDVDDLDSTTFAGGGWRTRMAGLKNVDLDLKGFWDPVPDLDALNNLGTVNRTVSVTPAGVAGAACYMFQGGHFSYDHGGSVGEINPFNLKISGTDGVGLVRGQLAAAKGNVSATGQLGSVLSLGAPTSTQYVYAILHVFTAGTTVTIQVQSDDSAGMSSPTTRGTIGPITLASGTWMTRVAGPFSGETHWRMNVSAITGTFNVAGAIGVQ